MVYQAWYEMIMRSSECFITNPLDKLVALAVALENDLAAKALTWSWASVVVVIQYHHASISTLGQLRLEIRLVGDMTQHGLLTERPCVLQLEGAVRINTELRFFEGRLGMPLYGIAILFIALDHDTRHLDVQHDSGRLIGWASLDYETRASIDGLVEGVTCVKVACHTSDRIGNGIDRGYMVLFISYLADLGAWQRVGVGQILDRSLFDGQEPTKIRLA
ncbi:hypothetical protein N657DRAFT_631999 [Parathielavia appendiculata]|uniref:Uncharacterized protein n=1 Tax=Parathielavia appendiculata TaxID=2587402 RepID=A0AAN6U668_9PEZI|nr:hypothetical protein N657DRAFT_631999 [Parathielavia appendiculata]